MNREENREENINNINSKEWLDRGNFFEHISKQGTDSWKNARIGRVNGSNTGALGGKSTFKTPEQVGKYIAGIEVEEFKQKNLDAMAHGHKYEDAARKWYENVYKCKVLERGLCVLKSDHKIGASVDGDIIETEGLIEIKCPQKMYKPILKYMSMKEQGWSPPPNFYDHIWGTHLYQCLQAMFVLKKKYCDYIVYSTEEQQVFVQRIYFNSQLWNEHYSIVCANYQTYVRPYLLPGYPLIPS